MVLHATALGLTTCPPSRPFEVGSTPAPVRDDVLRGAMSPHLLLRVGWAPGPPFPPTPRRPIDETLTPLDPGRDR